MENQEIITGSSFEIVGHSGDNSYVLRLKDLGFIIGSSFQVLSVAPFSGPIVVQLEESAFALREEELACLKIKTKIN